MKKAILAVIAAAFSLSLSAQEPVKVNYSGDRPTISDFAWALFSSHEDPDEEECFDEATNAIKQAWIRHRDGKPQEDGVTLTIDQKNGFVLYESREDDYLFRIEMCYWNESDKKHKLLAFNIVSFLDGKYSPGQFDGITFYRYDNASRTMSICYDAGFEVEYGTEDGAMISYALPRTGKDITVTYWYDTSSRQKTLSWNGSKFSF